MQAKCKEQQQQQQPYTNNHFSHNLAATATAAISSNNGGLIKDFNNQQQQTFYNNKTNKTKRLSVLSTTMPKQYNQQQQQIYMQPTTNKQHQQQQQPPHYMTQQHSTTAALLRKSPKPLYSLTLNNKYSFATSSPNPPSSHSATSTTATRNSLSNKDLTIYEFSHLKDCDLDHNDDYYLPSSTEILGIQKSLQHDNDIEGENDVASLRHKTNIIENIANDNRDEEEVEEEENVADEGLVEELDNKSHKRLSANLNDLEITKNATNNLLKQQQHTTNRLWYH